jgi:hypothetical protein
MTATSYSPTLGSGMRNPFWLLPIGAATGCLLFLIRDEGPLVQQAFIGAMWGAFGAVPVVIGAAFVLIALHYRRASNECQAHGLDWYSASYPEAAPADGEVRCRFCRADLVHPRNVNGRGAVRAWVCGACGETLFFSSPDREPAQDRVSPRGGSR